MHRIKTIKINCDSKISLKENCDTSKAIPLDGKRKKLFAHEEKAFSKEHKRGRRNKKKLNLN